MTSNASQRNPASPNSRPPHRTPPFFIISAPISLTASMAPTLPEIFSNIGLLRNCSFIASMSGPEPGSDDASEAYVLPRHARWAVTAGRKRGDARVRRVRRAAADMMERRFVQRSVVRSVSKVDSAPGPWPMAPAIAETWSSINPRMVSMTAKSSRDLGGYSARANAEPARHNVDRSSSPIYECCVSCGPCLAVCGVRGVSSCTPKTLAFPSSLAPSSLSARHAHLDRLPGQAHPDYGWRTRDRAGHYSSVCRGCVQGCLQ